MAGGDPRDGVAERGDGQCHRPAADPRRVSPVHAALFEMELVPWYVWGRSATMLANPARVARRGQVVRTGLSGRTELFASDCLLPRDGVEQRLAGLGTIGRGASPGEDQAEVAVAAAGVEHPLPGSGRATVASQHEICGRSATMAGRLGPAREVVPDLETAL